MTPLKSTVPTIRAFKNTEIAYLLFRVYNDLSLQKWRVSKPGFVFPTRSKSSFRGTIARTHMHACTRTDRRPFSLGNHSSLLTFDLLSRVSETRGRGLILFRSLARPYLRSHRHSYILFASNVSPDGIHSPARWPFENAAAARVHTSWRPP